MTRPEKLNELMDLLLTLQNTHYGITYDEMQDLYGFNRRKLERMMSILVEQFGNKIEVVENLSDRKKHFRLAKGTLNSFINFSGEDIVLLEQIKELLNDKSRKRRLNDIISKIKAINPKTSRSLETDVQYLLESHGYAVRQYTREDVSPNVYKLIAQAILEQKKLQFYYTNANGYTYKVIMHPYGVQYWEKNYLVGYDEYSKNIIKFAILRIKKIEKLDDYFDKDDNFNLQEYSSKAFGIYNSEPLNVKLLFDKSIKEDVLNYHFHPTQTMTEIDNGIQVEFSASGITEMCWNLFKWEDKVKIIAPAELKIKYKELLELIYNNIEV